MIKLKVLLFVSALLLSMDLFSQSEDDKLSDKEAQEWMEELLLRKMSKSEKEFPFAMEMKVDMLKEYFSDTTNFTKEKNFYKNKSDFKLYGRKVTYVGLKGIGLYVGPNAIVKGCPAEVVKSIKKQYKYKFRKDGKSYTCRLNKNELVVISSYPSIPGYSLVAGLYVGP